MKLKTTFIVIISVIFLAGCASKIMEGYIGKDIREVVLERGTPVNAMDMGNGVRAFQWSLTRSYTSPVQVSSTSTGRGYGSSYNTGYRTNYSMNTYVNTNTVITGGHTTTSTCLYTLFAKWNKIRNGWMVTGFKKPNIMCE